MGVATFIGVLYTPAVVASQLEASQSQQDIIWLVEDKIENKDLLTKKSPESSTASYIENLVIQQLTPYRVQVKRMTTSRINRILSTEDNICVANRGNTQERREYSLFSDPQSFYLTHKLYRFNQKTPLPRQLFNDKGEIKSLPEVFQVLPTQTIGIAKDVSLGKFFDQQIKEIPSNNIYYRGGTHRVVAMESMLYKSRVDFLLALPVDINPDQTQKQHLEQYTVAGAPPYLIAHFNCSKSEIGQKIIKDINNILAKLYQSKEYFQAHKRWFTDKQLADLQLFLAQKFPNNRYINSIK